MFQPIVVFLFMILSTTNVQSENVTFNQVHTTSKGDTVKTKDAEIFLEQSNKKNKDTILKDFDIKKRVKLIGYEDFKKLGKISYFKEDDTIMDVINSLKEDDKYLNSNFVAYIEGDVSVDGDIYLDNFFEAIRQEFIESLNTKHDRIALVWINGKLSLTGSLYTKDRVYEQTAFVVESDTYAKNIVTGGIILYFMQDLNVSEVFFIPESSDTWYGISGTENIRIETTASREWEINGNLWEFSDGISRVEVGQLFTKEFDFLYYDEDDEIYYLEEDLFVEKVLTGEKIFNSEEFLKNKTPDAAKKWKSHLSDDEEYDGIFADLQEEYLDKIPEYIVNNPKITSLELSDNKFKEFPRGISRMKNLKYLALDENPIASLPDNVTGIEVEALTFYKSPQLRLNEVVAFASKMQKLKRLCYSPKRKRTLDDQIEELDGLMSNLEGIKIESINNLVSSILPWKKSPANPKLDKLKESLQYKEEQHPLVHFPAELKEIEELYLHDLRFKTLQLNKPLPKLRELSLDGSVYKLTKAPRWSDFPAIKTVDLSLNNKYVAAESELKIIDSIQQLPNTVTELYLGSWRSFDPDVIRKIGKIPEKISHLENLEVLFLDKSHIDIGLLLDLLPKLKKLKELHIEEIELSFLEKRKIRKVLPKGCELFGGDD